MPNRRQQIENIIAPKQDPNGSGSKPIGNGLMQYFVNEFELAQIKDVLIASGKGFTEEFYNIKDGAYLIWDSENLYFRDKATGEKHYIEYFVEDFESGSLATNGWVKVDGGENDFEIGAAEKNGGTYGVYVSNDGGATNQYSSVGGGLDISHLYIDINLPASASEILLEFDWKCEAEVGFDFGEVFNATTGTTPTPNTAVSASLKVGKAEYNNQSIFTKDQIIIPNAQAGTTRRFIWSWRNDSIVENQPPLAIDNVKILYL